MGSPLTLALCLVVVSALALGAQTPVDFSGTWRLDTGQSSATGGGTGGGRGRGTSGGGGLGLGPPPNALTIVQTQTTLTIEQRGSSVAKLVYRLDGKRVQGKLPAGPSARDATYTSAWQNGGRLVTNIETRTPRGGPLTYQEVRYLRDANTLVVEIGDPDRGNVRRVVYRRVEK